MSERTCNIEQVIDRAKAMDLPTHYAIFLFLLHNRVDFSESDLQTFGRFDNAAWKVVNAKRPRPRCACHRNPPPPPAPHDVESALERARSMYYVLDVKRIEALLDRYPDCTNVVECFLREAEALVALKSFKDALTNGPRITARFVIKDNSAHPLCINMMLLHFRMEMTRVGWHEFVDLLGLTF